MAKEIKLEQFQGPLDLLLKLIEEEQLSITEISLATVTEQFFHYLSSLEVNRSDELADFLVIATRLVYLKSKQLLPYLYPAEDEGVSLADQLKLYKRYADASKLVEERWKLGWQAYGRIEPAPPQEGFVLPINARPTDLHSTLVQLLKRLKPVNPLPAVTIDRTVSVRQKVIAIYEALQSLHRVSFRDIVGNAENKTEVIVSFLALLELIKDAKISIHQNVAFDEMMIDKV
jgi:segregation and condensation protein A